VSLAGQPHGAGAGKRRIRKQGKTCRTASRHVNGFDPVTPGKLAHDAPDFGAEIHRRAGKVIAILDNPARIT
jgi:hypothetical protein